MTKRESWMAGEDMSSVDEESEAESTKTKNWGKQDHENNLDRIVY